MFLHLGEDYLINENDIIGIFDLDTSSVGKSTRNYLNKEEKANRLITVSDTLPRSFVVCSGFYGERTFLSNLSAATLKKRIAALK
jgi:hypothetical protein